MAKNMKSTKKEVPSKERQSPTAPAKRETSLVFHQEDRNIPSFEIGLPMPQGAKPPKKDDGADLSPSRPEKSSTEKSA